MTANRQLRTLLDTAGLVWLHPKELWEQTALRLLERVSQALGIGKRTLMDIWKEYERPGTPWTTPRFGPVSPAALDAALQADGDSLDTRIVRLNWQGGLFARGMQMLRWVDVAEAGQAWVIAVERRGIPSALWPRLAWWRLSGGKWLLGGGGGEAFGQASRQRFLSDTDWRKPPWRSCGVGGPFKRTNGNGFLHLRKTGPVPSENGCWSDGISFGGRPVACV